MLTDEISWQITDIEIQTQNFGLGSKSIQLKTRSFYYANF